MRVITSLIPLKVSKLDEILSNLPFEYDRFSDFYEILSETSDFLTKYFVVNFLNGICAVYLQNYLKRISILLMQKLKSLI